MAQIVHIYCSFGTEVETGNLIAEAFATQKRVIVPIAKPDTTILLHAETTSQTHLQTDDWGIPIPCEQTTTMTSSLCTPHTMMNARDCIIVPLLGFDAQLHRLGYGRGYYDRFLATFLAEERTKPYFIGLAFTEQFVGDGVRTEKHDIRLDMVITEQGIIGRGGD